MYIKDTVLRNMGSNYYDQVYRQQQSLDSLTLGSWRAGESDDLGLSGRVWSQHVTTRQDGPTPPPRTVCADCAIPRQQRWSKTSTFRAEPTRTRISLYFRIAPQSKALFVAVKSLGVSQTLSVPVGLESARLCNLGQLHPS